MVTSLKSFKPSPFSPSPSHKWWAIPSVIEIHEALSLWEISVFADCVVLFCQVMFRFALAVFKSSEELLLKCEDHMSIFNFLRQVPEKITDANILSQVSDSSYDM